jgi:hypothetical protein
MVSVHHTTLAKVHHRLWSAAPFWVEGTATWQPVVSVIRQVGTLSDIEDDGFAGVCTPDSGRDTWLTAPDQTNQDDPVGGLQYETCSEYKPASFVKGSRAAVLREEFGSSKGFIYLLWILGAIGLIAACPKLS